MHVADTIGKSRPRNPDHDSEATRRSRGGCHSVLQKSEIMYPENFRYTKQHEWVSIEADIGTVGITNHAQHELGDIVYVDLPKIGMVINHGSTLGSVESVKAVSDIYSPISGEVVEINSALSQKPELMNEDPHGGAWLAKVKLSEPDEIKSLLSAADYRTYIGE
ncbi:MAG: glycine cleavage system protein GcvH [Bryobacteraceae bacterium]